MARCYLSESGFMMSNRHPGPGWRLAEDAQPTGRPVLKLDIPQLAEAMTSALEHSASLRRDLAEAATRPSRPAGGQSFTDAVDALVASEKVTYGEAARRVALQRPELYEQHRQASMLSDEPRGMML